ncbi:MAG: phosphate ABC transporter substrate-binding protein [Elusimicrobia bacterium]|nr:phosphate ABC transporter substrate-binding protein [Candidatus Obscuribacterium magneticum]
MKRIGLFFVLCCAGLFFGCDQNKPAESLLIAGSSTFLRQTQKLSESFMKKNPEVIVVAEGGGSYAGLIAVRRGAINIAIMSHDIPDDMDDDVVKGYLAAKDGIGIIVNPSNPVENLSVDQIRAIFSGMIRDWSQVGGKKGPIALFCREQGSTSHEGFENMIMRGVDMCRDAVKLSSAAAIDKEVAGNPGAIGYVSTHFEQPGVKYLKVEGVPISKYTILSGRYPLSRSLYFVVAQRELDDEGDMRSHKKHSERTKNFIDFSRSREGQDILEKEGLYVVN